MSNKKALARKSTSTNTETQENQFQGRGFAVQKKSDIHTQKTDLNALLLQAKNFGHSISKLARQESSSASPQTNGLSIQPKLSIGEPGDRYEQEADRVASQVVQRINTPSSTGESVQREAMPEDEEELQMKPLADSIQRVEDDEEELQMKSLADSIQRVEDDEEELQMKTQVQCREAIAGGEASTDLTSAINSERGGGQAIADNIREPMEQAFGADFSGVKVHTDGQSDQLNQSIQARAFTTGQDVFFRQGEYNPGSRGGQELLAHELTHVVQQSGGVKHKKIQRNVIPYTESDNTNVYKDLESIAQKVQVCVNEAKELIDRDPTLPVYKDGSGYIGAWQKVYEKFIQEPNTLPDFFYARYGYAVETIACQLLGKKYGDYEINYQITAGQTRPDIVITKPGEEWQAWLDITSSGSTGHVNKKQHSGWQNRKYVAEITYPSLIPHELAEGATNLSDEQRNRLIEAIKITEADAAAFQRGQENMALAYGLACASKYHEKQKKMGNGLLSETDLQTIAVEVVKSELGDDNNITKVDCYRIISLLGVIEIQTEKGKESMTGPQLLNPGGNTYIPKQKLTIYGKRLIN
ncbi:MAG: eCIS core domain-containing protein [Nostoc sp.]